jgi:hypothetical protein
VPRIDTTATVIPFPLAGHFSKDDIAELERWAAWANGRHWFLQDAPHPGVGGVRWISLAENGDECVGVAYGHTRNCPYYVVIRRQHRWHLYDHWGDLKGTFKAIRSALETICPMRHDQK